MENLQTKRAAALMAAWPHLGDKKAMMGAMMPFVSERNKKHLENCIKVIEMQEVLKVMEGKTHGQ
ncbi:MAG: hypothetical protein FWE21_02945 [Defluviitaleaceae bacterium]|nr:hypothetical protein [Defluviitaleaceae bacterium]